MKFGEKVRDLRKKHSLTQDELAKCLGVSKRTVIGWERDGRYPRNVEILEKMADIFHVPLTYIQPDQSLFIERAAATVSYTHLDVYKRQVLYDSKDIVLDNGIADILCRELSDDGLDFIKFLVLAYKEAIFQNIAHHLSSHGCSILLPFSHLSLIHIFSCFS